MITLHWEGMRDDIGSLMARYAELPRHIAKKHLQAAMKRALKPGVPTLRRNTPPLGTRRGRRRRGSLSTGELRRAVKTKSKYKGKNASGYVYGVLGYGGTEMATKKAIWHEFGTSRGGKAKRMVANTMVTAGPQAEAILVDEMKKALEKAAKELASGMNPGWKG